MSEGRRFYGDLASWWPLISPPDDYAEEAAHAATLLRRAAIPVREVLELGSGGGHSAVHLVPSFALTLTDLSPEMLEVSRRLNPGCEHIVGDMRTLRLGRQFDAVLLHDAVDYMTTEHDLRAAMETAFVHCRSGGVAVLLPDHTTETFESDSDLDGHDGPDGRSVRYLEWTVDPDPHDTTIRTDYVFLFRHADGSSEVVHEAHTTGLFPEATWVRLLREVGFDPEVVTEETTEDRPPRRCFVAHRAT
ncbi:MAG: class I SAM-dependent methyltransferase [Ilumatobacteraceae bacterium]